MDFLVYSRAAAHAADSARRFVADEPYNRAGLYERHSIWLFENLLGQTMWEFPASDEPLFLVLAGDA